MIIYLLATTTALIALTGGLVMKMPKEGIGAHQGAILAAFDRAEQKLLFLEHAAGQALDEASRLLYEDQEAFFLLVNGDAVEGLGCGAYGYPLWNEKGRSCLLDEPLPLILDALGPQVLEGVAARTARYPGGGFTIPYTVSVTPGEPLIVLFTAEPRAELVLIGFPAGRSAEEARRVAEGGTLSGLLWPSDQARTITSCFGPRSGVAAAASSIHAGMDLPPGGKVLAAADGIVMNDPAGTAYGTVWIKHSETLSTGYLHLRDVALKRGDLVKAGQPIGIASDTGCAAKGCAPHLHFEVLLSEKRGAHAYRSTYAPGWYAINPACFYTLPESVISPSATQSCLAPNYPQPATKAYCDEYGLTLAEPAALTPGTAYQRRQEGEQEPKRIEEPALGGDGIPPSTKKLTSSQQAKFAATQQNMYRENWLGHVISASVKYGIPAPLLLGIITQESMGDPLVIGNEDVGLMQINDYTARLTRVVTESPLGGVTTSCGCTNTRATPGSGCRCTPENDRRLNPEYAVPGAAWLLKDERKHFIGRKDELKFLAASYNMGSPKIVSALRNLGPDASWDAVADFMEKNDLMSKEWMSHVRNYVTNVVAYAEAWNGARALDEGRAASLLAAQRKYGPYHAAGTYRFSPNLAVKAPDTLTPFVALTALMKESLERCAAAEIPGDCLLTETRGANPPILTRCEEPEEQYFLDLYQALRDCAENKQYDCACALPPPPAFARDYAFRFDQRSGSAALERDDEPLSLLFPEITGSSFRVHGAAPERMAVMTKDGTLQLTYLLSGERNERTLTRWNVRKGTEFPDQLVFTQEAAREECAPVKTAYAFCSAIREGMPPVTFSVTLIDDRMPEPVTMVAFDPATKKVTFTSPSPDVSFHNVYDAEPHDGLRPVLQLRGAKSFDASPFLGATLFVTPVDRSGNEGAAAIVVTGQG